MSQFHRKYLYRGDKQFVQAERGPILHAETLASLIGRDRQSSFLSMPPFSAEVRRYSLRWRWFVYARPGYSITTTG